MRPHILRLELHQCMGQTIINVAKLFNSLKHFLIYISLEHIFNQFGCQNGSGNLEPKIFLYWFLLRVAFGKRRTMGYESASTVDIIVDTLFSDFDFVEMNTQLQVMISSYLIFFLKKLLPSFYVQFNPLFNLQLWRFLCFLNLHQIQGFVLLESCVLNIW